MCWGAAVAPVRITLAYLNRPLAIVRYLTRPNHIDANFGARSSEAIAARAAASSVGVGMPENRQQCGAPWSPERRGWTFTVRGAGQAGRSMPSPLDHNPLASVGTLVIELRCSSCGGVGPMPVVTGLHAVPPGREMEQENATWPARLGSADRSHAIMSLA